MRRLSILVSLLVAIVGLGAAVALAAPSGDGPDPALARWPDWPGRVSCGELTFKPLVAFSRPANAERGDKPSEVALREALEEGLYAELGAPDHGWRLLAERGDYAEFGAGRPGRLLQVIPVEKQGKAWKQVGYSGGCEPAVVRKGRRAITWALASKKPLTPATRTIEVRLVGGECISGRSENELLERPVFRREAGALLMALWTRPVHGPQTCQELIEPPVKIRLPHRLGRLKLLDGSVFPPRSPYKRR
jgi:hypothetical protein